MLWSFGRIRRVITGPDFFIFLAVLVLTVVSFSYVHKRPVKSSHSVRRVNALSTSTARLPLAGDDIMPESSSLSAAATQSIAEPTLTEWQGRVESVAIPPATAPVFFKVPTTEPVVFLGIDDGFFKDPRAQAWLVQHKLPFSLFLDNHDIQNDYDYYKPLQVAGMTIEDHTLTHPNLAKLTLDQQKAEICGAADTYAGVYGPRPTLFRPPYGEYNDLTRQAAAECGMKAIIMWHAKVNGGGVQFQDTNTSLLPGDIVLMHFRPEFLQDMQAFVDQVNKDHMQVGRLEDWLQ